MELTDANYEHVMKENDKPIFIDFYSPSCAPCQILLEIIDNALLAYGKENGVDVLTCDVSRNSKLAKAFNIQTVPFTIAVLPDGKLKYPEIGLKDNSYYFSIIDKLAGKGSFFSRLFG